MLQNHNFKLREAYDKLAGAGVTVHSVKTDCFTIKAEHADLAKQLLDFGQDSISKNVTIGDKKESRIGTWRVSKTKDIIFPFETLKQTQLEDIAINPLNTQQLAVEDEWNT